MTTKHTALIGSLALIALILAASACNAPFAGTPAASPPGSAADPPSLPPDQPTMSATVPAEGDQTPPGGLVLTPTPPVPPEGWLEHRSERLNLAFYCPQDWMPVPVNEFKLDVRDPASFAWAEINHIDQTNAADWSLPYTPGMSAESILDILVEAAREDGTFDDPHHVVTRDGRTAWATQGVYDILEDNLFIGVIGYSTRAVVVLGHDTGEPGDWQSRLLPLYQVLFESITSGP
jgi:hypothetical protein